MNILRKDFSRKIVLFLMEIIKAKQDFIIDYVKRSNEEQQRLYLAGKSKCDGKIKISKHQIGKAMDIYFIDDKNKLTWSGKTYKHWHKVWQKKYSGTKMITWDQGHFE